MYFSVQIEFDKKLIYFGYFRIKPFFQGPKGLELGSGDGDMTKYIINDFDSLTIVDGSAELLSGIPESPKLSKIHSLFENYETDKKYNKIIMGHILEHVNNPVKLINRAKNWLAPGGKIIAIVPNAYSFHRLAAVKMGLLKNPTELNSRDISVGHRRVYTPESFENEFILAGLKVNKLGGIFFKPLANSQIQEYFSEEMMNGFYELGEDFQYNCAEIYIVCSNK